MDTPTVHPSDYFTLELVISGKKDQEKLAGFVAGRYQRREFYGVHLSGCAKEHLPGSRAFPEANSAGHVDIASGAPGHVHRTQPAWFPECILQDSATQSNKPTQLQDDSWDRARLQKQGFAKLVSFQLGSLVISEARPIGSWKGR